MLVVITSIARPIDARCYQASTQTAVLLHHKG